MSGAPATAVRSAATGGGGSADQEMTGDREETKYLVPRQRVAALMDELGRSLSSHRFTGEGANRLPDAHHFVTTVYFDTGDHGHYRASVADVNSNVKVRAKEYYDVHPSLAELATDVAQIVRYQPWMWFELKRREGARTIKHRFRLPKRHVPSYLGGGAVPATTSLVNGGTDNRNGDNGGDAVVADAAERAGVAAIVEYCQGLGQPLVASCLVNYRRHSWQDPAGTLRVTLDLDLGFFAAPADLWQRGTALVRGGLGPVRTGERRAVLEVKRRAGAETAWLDHLLRATGVAPVTFSKFVAAAEAIHGRS
jgi:hypothetical protein